MMEIIAVLFGVGTFVFGAAILLHWFWKDKRLLVRLCIAPLIVGLCVGLTLACRLATSQPIPLIRVVATPMGKDTGVYRLEYREEDTGALSLMPVGIGPELDAALEKLARVGKITSVKKELFYDPSIRWNRAVLIVTVDEALR